MNERQEPRAESKEPKAVPAPKERGVAVITVRVPRSLHQAILLEAFERGMSMNQLCRAKLSRPLELGRLTPDTRHPTPDTFRSQP